MPKLGAYTLHAIETGRFGLDGGAMFGIVPKPLWSRRIPPDARNRIPLNMRSLLLEAGDQLILIDTGIGDKTDARFRDLYAIDHDYAELHRSLHAAGFDAADVTDVILTHLHFDHSGGSTRRVGETLVPTFVNARYHVQRRHWDWAMTPNYRERGSFIKENFEPLVATGQLNLLDGDGPLFPGIEVITIDGHTEQQQMVKIAGPEGTLVFVADLIPTSAHLGLAWGMSYDDRPLVTVEEKAAFLEKAVAEGWHLFFLHDPEVAVASLTREGKRITATSPRSVDEL